MATVEEDMNALEKDIRAYKIEFEQYFGGGKKRPPNEIEWRIDTITKRYSERGQNMNSGQRFRFSTLVQAYVKYREMFKKRVKKQEEGVVDHHFGAAAKAIQAQRAHTRKHEAGRKVAFAITCSDPDQEASKVENLFVAFTQAQRDAGEKHKPLSLEQFREFIRKKTQQLKDAQHCREVEYRIEIEDGEVRLKAAVPS
jgi:hypothetical protein